MISKPSLCKVLNFRVSQLNECSQKFKEALDGYVGQITGSAQVWIEQSEACDQQQFVEVTVPLEQAMMMLLEMTSEIESNMSCHPLGANSTRSVLTSAADSLPQTNVQSQSLDASLRTLLERLEGFQNVTDMIQELRTDLDVCKQQVDLVEEMQAELEHLTSQYDLVTLDSSLQQKFNQFQNKQSSKLQKFEKKLSKLEQALSKTDSQIKSLTSAVNAVDEQFTKCMTSLSGFEEELQAVGKKSAQSSILDESCPDEAITENTDDRVRAMEEKLAQLEAENQRMKAQIDRESGERERGSNDVRDVQEKLSALEVEISNLKGSKVGSLDGSMQSVEEHGSVQSEEENGSEQSAEENGSLQSAEENGSEQSAEENGSEQSAEDNWSVQSASDDRKLSLVEADSVESDVLSEVSAAKKKETSKHKWTGFCTQCVSDIRTVSRSRPIAWSILGIGTSGGFNDKTGIFTAPVDGLYFVIFVHRQIGGKPTTIRVLLLDKAKFREKAMITTSTSFPDNYSLGQRHLFMNAGDRFYLSLPKHGCRYQIPFFSCVLVG